MRTSNALVATLILMAAGLAGCVANDGEPGEPATRNVSGQRPALGSAVVEPGQYVFDLPFSQVLAPGTLEILPPVRNLVASEIDGEDIEIGYWLPKVEEGTKVPVILHASPYHRPAGSVINGNQSIKRFLIHNFVPLGYAVAAVAVRGTGDSGGCMVMGDSMEAADLSQAVTWLATQDWANGNVGMIGLSYDGSTPWMVAGTGNPHLKTIVPVSGVTDWHRLMFRNGSAELRSQLIMNYAYWEYSWNVVTPIGAGSEPNRAPDKRVDGVLCPEAYQGLAAATYATVEGGRDMFGFWDDRNHRPRVEANYKGSILNVHGLDDWNVDPSSSLPWVNELNATQGLFVHQMLGQWQHTLPDRKGNSPSAVNPPHRLDFAETLLDWFDYFLKEETSVDLGPAVTVQDHTYRWRVEESWPPRDAQWSTFHLREGNQLAPEPGGSAQSVVLLPNPAAENQVYGSLRAAPGYAADFSTSPMEETVNIAGLPRVHVTVSARGPVGHLAAWLYDVAPDGEETRIGWTAMNLRYYNADEEPKTLTPGEQFVAKLEIQPMDARIEAGHRVVLRLWAYSSEEHVTGNADTCLPDPVGVCTGPPAVKDRNTLASFPVDVHFGGTVQSIVEIPFVTSTEEQYFRPPMPEGFAYPYEQ